MSSDITKMPIKAYTPKEIVDFIEITGGIYYQNSILRTKEFSNESEGELVSVAEDLLKAIEIYKKRIPDEIKRIIEEGHNLDVQGLEGRCKHLLKFRLK